jgi:hypothetical protein
MIIRAIEASIHEAMNDTPVVLINGARQTGKSTLARRVAERAGSARYVSLDESSALTSAQSDPGGFIDGFSGLVVIDEIQRVPDLFRAIKAAVDRNRAPGRFLLTGSADIMMLPRLSESLAGRMEIMTLWPFSQGELRGLPGHFVDTLFDGSIGVAGRVAEPVPRDPEVWGRILMGGYPEVVARTSEARRRAWFVAYVTTVLRREIRDIANIDGLQELPRLLAILAARMTQTVNYASLARSAGLPQTTLKRYVRLLEASFLVQLLPAWSANLGKRLVTAPKAILVDSGLAAHLVGIRSVDALRDQPHIGPLFENYVAMEIRKQITWSSLKPKLFHFRTSDGQEVDLVLEDASGRLVGIESKASATVLQRDFNGLAALKALAPERFVLGVVLYTGSEVVPFGRDLYAVPVGREL